MPLETRPFCRPCICSHVQLAPETCLDNLLSDAGVWLIRPRAFLVPLNSHYLLFKTQLTSPSNCPGLYLQRPHSALNQYKAVETGTDGAREEALDESESDWHLPGPCSVNNQAQPGSYTPHPGLIIYTLLQWVAGLTHLMTGDGSTAEGLCTEDGKTLPVIIFKTTKCSEFPQSEGDRHGKVMWIKGPWQASSSLWFLSHCCSVDFCESHCHRDRRGSKIACLLDLPGMERLYILHSLSFSNLLYRCSCKARDISAFLHFTLLLWLCAIKLHTTVFQATICPQLCSFWQNTAWVFTVDTSERLLWAYVNAAFPGTAETL